MKTMWTILFMVMPLIAMAYVGRHVWILLPFSALWKSAIIIVCVLSFVLLFLNFGRRFDCLPLPLARVAYEVGTSSIFVLLYLVMLFLVLDLGRLCHVVPKSLLYSNANMAIGVLLFIFGLFIYGNLHYNNKVRVELKLPSQKYLKKDYKVVMASDLHIGYHNSRKELARWIDLMNAEKPDFILIAGDIIDGSMRPILEDNMVDEFRRLKAPVYACLGNHEFYAGNIQAREFYKKAGLHLLVDEFVVIDNCIAIVGRDDQTNIRRKPIEELVTEIASDSLSANPLYTIILDHQPYHLERVEKAGADFQLSGHTHRGQVWPISWITDYLYECSWGSHQRGTTRYYVSSGLGIWGGKFRIGTQSEYVVATIKSKR